MALILAGGGLGSLGGLPFIFLAMIAMYLLMIVPNQRKQKQWQSMLSKIKAGDRVTTTGGIRGAVVPRGLTRPPSAGARMGMPQQ